MMAACKPLPFRQELIQMTAPARRVLSAAQPLRLGGVKDALDPAAKPRCGFRLVIPKTIEDREHVIGGDLIHWKTADGRRVDLQGHFPLRSMLAVAPGGAHGPN